MTIATIPGTFSAEDYQICINNQLGEPLDIYRLKAGHIKFLNVVRWIMLTISIAGLLIVGIAYSPIINTHPLFINILPGLVGVIYTLIQGGVIHGLRVRQARGMRVLVCRHGLVQIMPVILHDRVEVAQWQDIRPIKKDYKKGSYTFYSFKNGAVTMITLTSYYERLAELAALIKQHSQQKS